MFVANQNWLTKNLKICEWFAPINYTIKHSNINNTGLYAHLHCYNIDDFDNIYGYYINYISKYFEIIITYSIGTNIPSNYTVLEIPNKGMDIGAKFCMVKFLKTINLTYKYILFLHSKSDILQRVKYFDSLIDNLSDFIE